MLGAPLQTRPDHIELARRGAYTTHAIIRSWPQWKRAFPATLRAMRRWSPDSPVLRMNRDEAREAYRLGWEAGFQAGAGYKP